MNSSKSYAVARREDLLAALLSAKDPATRKTPLPMSGMVRLTMDCVGLVVCAADGVVSTRDEVPTAEAGADFDRLLPIDKVIATLRAMATSTVSLEVVDGGNKLRISGGRSRVHVAAASAEDFPEYTAPDMGSKVTASIPGAALYIALRCGAVSMYEDDSRPHMCGALVGVVSGKVRCVSTDGHRLSVCDVEPPASEVSVSSGCDVEVYLPRLCIEELQRFCVRSKDRSMLLSVGGPLVEAQCCDDDGYAHSTTLRLAADVRFPPWEKLMGRRPSRLTVQRDDMRSALGVACAAHGKTRKAAVRFELCAPKGEEPASLRLTAESETGDASSDDEIVVGATKECSGGFKWTVNSAYVSDALRCMSEIGAETIEVDVGVTDRDAMAMFASSADGSSAVNFSSVIMPMRFDH